MRQRLAVFCLFVFLITPFLSCCQSKATDTNVYKIIVANDTIPGHINYEVIQRLNEKLKAILALYTYLGASCEGDFCHIAASLGLGEPASEAEKALIRKYFPSDTVAQRAVRGELYLGGEGSSEFSDFTYLTITDLGKNVKIDYSLLTYNRGNSSSVSGPDIYQYLNSTYSMKKRHLFSWIDKNISSISTKQKKP